MNKFLNGNFYIWGTGFRANELNKFSPGELQLRSIDGYIDNNPRMWGKTFWNKTVYSPDILLKNGKNYVFIANQYENEIKKQLDDKYSNRYELLDEEVLLRIQILSRYWNSNDAEILQIVNRLKKKPLEVFNYDFVEKYDSSQNDVLFDEDCGLFYVYYFGKRLYFSRNFDTAEKVQVYYRSILLEQDAESPHVYLTKNFDVQRGAVVIDAGVAEGNFSLAIIDKVSKIFMFEPDKDWVEALKKTFEPYADKVVIINKCLSNYVDDYTTTIDTAIKGKINFIKMDIEGEELYALKGAKSKIAESRDFKCLICTYHQEFAYEAITQYLDKCMIEYETSAGYMWYPDGKMRSPVLRRGIVRGIKK